MLCKRFVFHGFDNGLLLTVRMGMSSFLGLGKLNQLGGVFFNGKPLPNSVRQQIIEMAELGIRPCDISRQLKVSHGCISKLLSKYNNTGSFEPGRATKKKAIEVSPTIAKKIDEYRRTTPGIFSWEVKEKLLADGLCSKKTLPHQTDVSGMLREEMHRTSSFNSEREATYGREVNLEIQKDAAHFFSQEEGSKLPTQMAVENETSK